MSHRLIRIVYPNSTVVFVFLVTEPMKCGIAPSRIKSAGMSYNDPVASNDTAEGRAQNRRVEIYISANENMIRAAENGTLQ